MKQLYLVYNYGDDMHLYFQFLDSEQYGDYYDDSVFDATIEYYAVNTHEQFMKMLNQIEDYDIQYNIEHLKLVNFNHFKNNLLWLMKNKVLQDKIVLNDSCECNYLLTKDCKELPFNKNEKDFQKYIFFYCRQHKIKIENDWFDLLQNELNKIDIDRKNILLKKYLKEMKILQEKIKELQAQL